MKEYESLSLRINEKNLWILDQTLLPHEETWVEVKNPDHMVKLLQSLSVRGAPLIGVAAALSLALYSKNASSDEILNESEKLRKARPTAVNLMWAMDQMISVKLDFDHLYKKAMEILSDDINMCEKMSSNGAQLINDGDGILTHCNSGALATSGIGTGLGVIRKAHELGKKIHVYVDETRPLLQGARLTAYECKKMGVDYTLLCDTMAAVLMAKKKIQKVFLGADRIAMNGDFANKIGTYSVAISAQYHGVEFYPVAPISTVDPKCEKGSDIEIEQRSPLEVHGYKTSWSPKNAPVFNPAFDVTPVSLITSMVLDTGVYSRKELEAGALKKLFKY